MTDATTPGFTRRKFLVGGAAGAAVMWGAPKLGFLGRADAQAWRDATALAAASAASSLATLPFFDNFDQELPSGLLTNWNVDRGIRLVGTSPFGIASPGNDSLDLDNFLPGFLSGHGLAVAMDGPIGPGRIETLQAFLFEAQHTYTLSFDVAGSHRAADPWPATLVASLPGIGAALRVTRLSSDGFEHFELRVQPPVSSFPSTIVFQSDDAPGQAGLVLDNVSLRAG